MMSPTGPMSPWGCDIGLYRDRCHPGGVTCASHRTVMFFDGEDDDDDDDDGDTDDDDDDDDDEDDEGCVSLFLRRSEEKRCQCNG